MLGRYPFLWPWDHEWLCFNHSSGADWYMPFDSTQSWHGDSEHENTFTSTKELLDKEKFIKEKIKISEEQSL